MSKPTALIIGFIFILSSCSEKTPHSIIKGKIEQANLKVLYLERHTLSETTVVDEIQLDSDGKYEFEIEDLGYSEFYILRLDDQTINIALDSVETVTINASSPTFASEYTVEGSVATSRMKETALHVYDLQQNIERLNKEFADQKIAREKYVEQLQAAIDTYKNSAKEIIRESYSSSSAYHALFQQIGGLLIFDPMENDDLRYFRAVATSWDQSQPDSPRSKHLYDYTLTAAAQKKQLTSNENALVQMIENGEMEYSNHYQISLPDIRGEMRDLSTLRGKVAILDFTSYQTKYSPAHNIMLNTAYKQLKEEVEIYQIAFDADLHTWQNAAENLPWICVIDSKSSKSALIAKFNISTLPTTYIIDKNGMPAKRIMPTDDIVKEVNKLRRF